MTTQAESEPLLVVEDLTTWFPTPRGLVHAVDGVSFALKRGETVGIVGESGSGKSVLARSIMRLVPSGVRTGGHVRFDGRDLMPLRPREMRTLWGRELAMVFQNPMTSLNPVLRIGRQVAEPLRLHLGLGRQAAAARALELLELVGIPEASERMRSYPHELSGGMRQRVSIAIAIACSPKLLLADEPTTALDVTVQRQILDLLTDLQRRSSMAMVLITHDFGVVAGRTNSVVVMYGGRVVESGPTAELFRACRHPYTASLLAAIPRIGEGTSTRLAAIPGRPVDVVDPAPGCRFAARCSRAGERCFVEDPAVVEAGLDEHAFSCFNPLDPGEAVTGQEAPVVSSATTKGRRRAGAPVE